MAQTGEKKLESGDLFPEMTFTVAGGDSVTWPGAVRGKWSMLLVYRGRW